MTSRPALLSPATAPDSASDEVRVVVVDDYLPAAEAMGEALAMDGYEVRVVPGAREALALIADFHPHCVILDINMPGMDGCELAQELRSTYGADMVLIAVTGYGDLSQRVAQTLPLVDHFLNKPVDSVVVQRLLPPAHAPLP